MEAGSLYLVAIELLLAYCGGIHFLYRTYSKRNLLSKAEVYVVLLTVISSFWFLLGGDAQGRWLSLKATIFVSCLYLSSKFPRQGMLLLAALALTGYLLDDIVNGQLFSKHIGENANQILSIPFLLIVCAVYLYRRDYLINTKVLYLVALLEITLAIIIHARADAINAIILIMILSSLIISKIFIKISQWIPLIYIATAVASYYALVHDINVVSPTPSNMERSSMVFAAIDHFFDYSITGPRMGFNNLVTAAMGAIDCSHIHGTIGGQTGVDITGRATSFGADHVFLCKPYHDIKGIDPHNFFLSVWRDEGAILTLLWVLAWFYYWNAFRSLKPQLDDTRIRLVIGMLAMSVVQFSLAPPSTGMRLMVALIMGSALGFANKRPLVNAVHLSNQDRSSKDGHSMIQGDIGSNSENGANSGAFHVVHVTEALTAGVLYYLHQLIKAQVEAGLKVTLVHSYRRDTPAQEILDQLFPLPISRFVIPMTTNISIMADFKSFKDIAKLLKSLQPDVIHLHSSKAGALGRFAAWYIGLNKSLYYSPHGFSFLRQDVNAFKRAIFLCFEVIGGIFGGKIIASSASEGRLANRLVGHHRVSVVENCTDVPEFTWPKGASETRLRIISAGRLCYQKAPWRFWNLSASLSSENSEFIWIGDGELRKRLEGDAAYSTVHVTGWIDRKDLWQEMYSANLYVMTSLWEGMPLTLIDAQVIGLPAIVPDVVGCRDVVVDGVTGFVCKNDSEIIEKTKLLIRDTELRARMGQAARSMATERFSIKRMHKEILNAYDLSHNISS